MRIASCWAPFGEVSMSFDRFLAGVRFLSRIWRVRVGVTEDGEFDPYAPCWPSSLSFAFLVRLARVFRAQLILCIDPCVGGEAGPHTYHKQPHRLNPANTSKFTKQVLAYWDSVPHPPIIAVEYGNEVDYMGWIPRDPSWETLEGIYNAYANCFYAVQVALGEERRIPLIVGGSASFWHRDELNGHPSICVWMHQQFPNDSFHLAWHPGPRHTPEDIRRATQRLRELGREVWITEDVYQEIKEIASRAHAARLGGASLYTLWHCWPKAATTWRSGQGIAPEVYGQSGVQQARYLQCDAIAASCNKQWPTLTPRQETMPSEPLPEEPEPVEPSEDPYLKLARLIEARNAIIEVVDLSQADSELVALVLKRVKWVETYRERLRKGEV